MRPMNECNVLQEKMEPYERNKGEGQESYSMK